MAGFEKLFGFVAALCCGLFAGAALYLNLVEHPARMECGTELAATEFPPSYRRATVLQVSLALIGALCGTLAWLRDGSLGWLIAACLLLSVIPFTLIFILPANNQLLDASLVRRAVKAHLLLTCWNRLQSVRSIVPFAPLFRFLSLPPTHCHKTFHCSSPATATS